MKKTYMKPEIDEMLVAVEHAILAGSIEAGLSGEEQDNEQALSRELGFDFNIFE